MQAGVPVEPILLGVADLGPLLATHAVPDPVRCLEQDAAARVVGGLADAELGGGAEVQGGGGHFWGGWVVGGD